MLMHILGKSKGETNTMLLLYAKNGRNGKMEERKQGRNEERQNEKYKEK